MNYKELLSYQTTLSGTVNQYVEDLINGRMSPQQYHGKKYYAKTKGQLLKVLELTMAFEIVTMMEK